ncbi:MAG: D-glycero-beta-D-manno-heptose-1,7-bisphosphate 7-phosphatase [Gammaproteobacteria bacterium]|jgi:D-glycero-D-manno-heptose 1,7-bisphosphate phosphatase|nr:D-glycero-beta-D-manno-heptose-1,7-bisphosphate 7-phosphatase [Chloroflexota bacterium]MBC59866.1 D-glycero-beta-D-manno-heptose-1,7-bisphosphate 7-phosphatase [Gammaproteobacteria bacterium]MCH2578133.1 D-glycero-beta-D-manno-heptose 1,7-bisphosphate 7-phosphatase [Pseudomonadales bacterium]MBI91083.1 D-glycero-beta-D-manno-heptose-1,7-bisphosphate 7-phosphatase [Gammaproteobacteria bacterium]HAI16529.1 D-glycero-beta-D-manno-heptose-1,7-bisphosphate 7-phosphatase [Gammaproteobacteria bacte|tara:strand:- start:9538 stop:10089 length:552 start_codon:yes stop_codon:yes gene_type:complete
MKTVVLDRDGVINEDTDAYVKTPGEWVPIPGSLEAIASLHSAGYRVVVASNQSGLSRGLFDEQALANIHHKFCLMAEEAGGFIDGIFFCPHLPEDNCDCRKPATGLLAQIEKQFACSLKGCFLVGDRYTDIQAALLFGLNPILVRTGKGLDTEKQLRVESNNSALIVDNLAMAVTDIILKVHE